jgi:hypothetical protein
MPRSIWLLWEATSSEPTVRLTLPRLYPVLPTDISYSRLYRQGSPDGRIDYRGYPEAVLKTYGACPSNQQLFNFTHFNIEVGDYVERDEEIATIETDKVCWQDGRIDRLEGLLMPIFSLPAIRLMYQSMPRSLVPSRNYS